MKTVYIIQSIKTLLIAGCFLDRDQAEGFVLNSTDLVIRETEVSDNTENHIHDLHQIHDSLISCFEHSLMLLGDNSLSGAKCPKITTRVCTIKLLDGIEAQVLISIDTDKEEIKSFNPRKYDK